MRRIINKDKNGKIIEDISKVEIPLKLQRDIFEILNPGLKADQSPVVTKTKLR